MLGYFFNLFAFEIMIARRWILKVRNKVVAAGKAVVAERSTFWWMAKAQQH